MFKDRKIIRNVVQKVRILVTKELAYTCTRNAKSLYGNKSLEDINMFHWSKLAIDMKQTMQTLFSILGQRMKRTL